MNVNPLQSAKVALHPSEQDCRRLVDSIPGHVVTLTAHGDIDFVNQQWLDYLGKTRDELQNWTNRGVVHPDDLSRVVSTWNRSVETGQPYDSECRFSRADGVFPWFHVRAIPEREAEGRIVRWYCLHTDIDERKQAEDRLQLLLDVTNQVVSNLQIDDLLRAQVANQIAIAIENSALLLSYPWPGNIRELQNVVERSVIVCETENFSVDESWLSQRPLASEPTSHVKLTHKLAAHERDV